MLPPSPPLAKCPSFPLPDSANLPSSTATQTANPDQPMIDRQQIEIRCFCHLTLFGAKFSISHDDRTNDFFAELVPSGNSPICEVLFRFVLLADDIILQIFSSSYGHWRPNGSAHLCSAIGEGPLRLDVHVHQQHYSVQMNGTEVQTVVHKKPFYHILIWKNMEEEAEEEEQSDIGADDEDNTEQ